MRKTIICLFVCFLSIQTTHSQNKTYAASDSVLWKEFRYFLDSKKLYIIENFYDIFKIRICDDVYTVIFAFDYMPEYNKGLILEKNGREISCCELLELKEKMVHAIKNKNLKKKGSGDETTYEIECPSQKVSSEKSKTSQTRSSGLFIFQDRISMV